MVSQAKGKLSRMATAADLLTQTNAAIEGLLNALAGANIEEYALPDGRRIRRADFARTLDSLRSLRTELLREAAAAARGGRVRLGKFGRPQ